MRRVGDPRGSVGDALPEHGVGDLLESGDVGSGDEVALHSVPLGRISGLLVDSCHDVLELGVDLLEGPGEPGAVLAHLQGGGGDTAGVGGLATPPALAALAGPNRIPAFWKAAMAPGVLGMFAPSATALTPLAMRVLASSSFSSFWVAQGSAMSQGMVQMPLPSVYLALGLRTAYSLILCLLTSLMSLTRSRSIPSAS